MGFGAGRATMGQSVMVCHATAVRQENKGAEHGAGPGRHLPAAAAAIPCEDWGREGLMPRR